MSKLMTNLLPFYYNFLQQESEATRKTKKEIVEEGIELYIKEKERKQIMAQYQAMGKDIEHQDELLKESEMGMDYFLNDIEDAN